MGKGDTHGYDDPIPEFTPEEREKNLKKTSAEEWAEAEESLMDKALETLRKVNDRERSEKENPPESSAAS